MILTSSNIVKEIMEYAVLENEKTDACVFVSYAGHVNVLSVEVYLKNDWETKEPNIKDDVDCTKLYSRNRLLNLRESLKELLTKSANCKEEK